MRKVATMKVEAEFRDELKVEAFKSGMTIVGLLRVMLRERKEQKDAK